MPRLVECDHVPDLATLEVMHARCRICKAEIVPDGPYYVLTPLDRPNKAMAHLPAAAHHIRDKRCNNAPVAFTGDLKLARMICTLLNFAHEES